MEHALAVTNPSQVMIADRVSFSYQDREYVGTVARKGKTRAQIVCDDGQEFRVPYQQLYKIPGAAPHSVQTVNDTRRAHFHVNARVQFVLRGTVIRGTLSRLNPTRAHVVGENGKEYRVPYAVLTRCATTLPPSQPLRTGTALAAIGTLARDLLAHHHLSQWSFQFDNATKRAGCCHYARQQISLSYEFAQQAADEEIRDTLLHEIAHALVGKEHQHDDVWRAKALEIGCSGRRCYDRQFTAPRYIVQCENRCWVATTDRRRRGVVCQQCHGQLVYLTYTEERWKHERATRAPWTKASGSA